MTAIPASRSRGLVSWLSRFLKRQVGEIRAGGPREALRRLLTFLAIPAALVAVLGVRLLRPIVTVRFVPLLSARIGYAGHTEIYLLERDAGLHGSRIFDIFYDYPYHSGRVRSPWANKQLKKMWYRTLPVYGFAGLLDSISQHLPGARHHTLIRRRGMDRDIHGVFAGSKPHLSFTTEEERFGLAELRRIGVPEGSPYVCFNARDSAYLEAMFPEADGSRHDYRNADIHNFLPAARELTRRGYYTLRMGSIVKEPLNSTDPMIIDYATEHRTDFLDIYLGAHCRFLLSTGTGIDVSALLFRRPEVLVNFVPLEQATTWDPTHLFIPKKLWLRKEGRFMTFREIFGSGAGNLLYNEEYVRRGIDVIQNTPDEILAVTVEMDERLQGIWRTTEEDEDLQRRFWSLFKPSDLHGVFISRIGAEFLRQNRDLLE